MSIRKLAGNKSINARLGNTARSKKTLRNTDRNKDNVNELTNREPGKRTSRSRNEQSINSSTEVVSMLAAAEKTMERLRYQLRILKEALGVEQAAKREISKSSNRKKSFQKKLPTQKKRVKEESNRKTRTSKKIASSRK